MLGFNYQEVKFLRRLNSPVKIQDYLESIKINFKDTCLSPRRVMRERQAHCMEGAMFAAAALWVNGERPLILDLKAIDRDDDHVVAVFRRNGRWGAISKTNHAVLRYREPIYASIRELAISYFHEYFLDDGRKTMRSFSRPFDLRRFGRSWLVSEENLWDIPKTLDKSLHCVILTPRQIRSLRHADRIEIAAGKLTQWRKTE